MVTANVYSYDGQIRMKIDRVPFRLSVEEARRLAEMLVAEVMDLEIEQTLKNHEDLLDLEREVA